MLNIGQPIGTERKVLINAVADQEAERLKARAESLDVASRLPERATSAIAISMLAHTLSSYSPRFSSDGRGRRHRRSQWRPHRKRGHRRSKSPLRRSLPICRDPFIRFR
jgi:hypothetical protein